MKRKVKGLHLLSLCSLMLACTATFAAHSPAHFEVIGAVSSSRVHTGNTTLGVTTNETDTLVQTNDDFRHWNSWGFQVGLGYVYFLGNSRQFSNNTQWFPMVEPELNLYFNDYDVSGNVNRFGNPAFNELNYKQRIRSTRVMFDLALTLLSKQQFSAYVIAGIGQAWNDASYSDAANGNASCNIQGLNLGGRTNAHFAWEAGAGIVYALNDVAGLSFEYLYTNFGRIRNPSSGNTGVITMPTIVPGSFNFHTQAFLLGVHVAV